jgi:hypothetical protein
MRAVIRFRRFLNGCLALLAMGGCLLLTGCASTADADNVSERPWNAPRNWEGGLPAGMMEGR